MSEINQIFTRTINAGIAVLSLGVSANGKCSVRPTIHFSVFTDATDK